MVSSLNSSAESFVTTINQISDKMSKLQSEVSTGIRVANVSDEPDSVSSILLTRAHLSTLNQVQTNLSMVKAETDSGEQALQSAVTLLEKAQTLGTQGVTATATADSRTALASQVGSILQEMVGLSNTNINGRYIFSGDTDQQAPYTVDLTQTPAVSSYAGASDTREVQHPNGSTFAVSENAQTIFDATDSTQNVFSSLSSLYTALTNNDQTGISSALENVGTSLKYLNVQLSFYGNVQTKVADATDYGANLKLQLQTQLSALQDADSTEAISELSQVTYQQSAALQVRAKIPNTSLFDYMG